MNEVVDRFGANTRIIFRAIVLRPIHNRPPGETFGAVWKSTPSIIVLHNIRIRKLAGFRTEKHPRQEQLIAGIMKRQPNAKPFIIGIVILRW